MEMVVIFKRELASYFSTPLAYVFIVIFLVLAGVFTFYLGNFYERGQADLVPFFNFHPWLYLFLIPAVSMRLWAEERKTGTVELLLTLPTPTWTIVVGKFLAAWAFIAIAIALLIGTYCLWRFTRFGLIVRGTMQNPDMARGLGVNTDRVFMLTFGFGAALTGFAGAVLVPITGAAPPESAKRMVEIWRGWLEKRLGQRMRKLAESAPDQEAFAARMMDVIQALNLIDDQADPLDPDDQDRDDDGGGDDPDGGEQEMEADGAMAGQRGEGEA